VAYKLFSLDWVLVSKMLLSTVLECIFLFLIVASDSQACITCTGSFCLCM